jgi:hypothetical protein
MLALKAETQRKAARVLTVAYFKNLLADSEAWF